jgi:hypothetical protein
MDLNKNDEVVAVVPVQDKWAVYEDEQGTYAHKVDFVVVVKVPRMRGSTASPFFLHGHHVSVCDEDGCIGEMEGAKRVVTAASKEDAIRLFNLEKERERIERETKERD